VYVLFSRVLAKNHGDPYYEHTIVVHDEDTGQVFSGICKMHLVFTFYLILTW